jgi:transposase-like protein
MTDFALSYKERSVLEQLTRCSTNGAKEYRRTQALLWLDKGESVQEIAERLRVSRQSIYNWAMRFQEREELDIVARLVDG